MGVGMRQKLFFLFLGFLLSVGWLFSLAWELTPPFLPLIACSLAILRLSRSAAVGGSCLSGFIADAMDWEARLGAHAATLAIASLLCYGIQRRFDVGRLFAWPVTTLILSLIVSLLEPLTLHILGHEASLPPGWWTLQGLHALQLSALSCLLLPWRRSCSSSSSTSDEVPLLTPLFLQTSRSSRSPGQNL